MGIEQNGRQEEREQILGTPPLVPPGSANRGEDLRNDPEMAPAPPLGEPGPRRRTAASPATVSPAHVQMYHAAKYEPGGDDEMGQVMRLIFSPSQRLVAGRDARPHTAPLVDDFLAGLEGHTDNKVDHTPEQRKGGAGADNESAPTPQQRNGDSTGAGSESTPPPKSRALPPQTPQTPRALREAAVTSAGALLTAAVFVPGTDLLAVAGTDKRLVLHSLAVGATPNQQKQGPKIHFMPAQRMRDGYSQPLVDAGRFQVISSPFLLAQGARRYCWLMPGEELTDAGGGAPWCPCHHGGFVYLFSEELNYECYFSISPGEPNESASVQGLMFPDTLGPFTVVTTALRPDLDVETTSWKITHSEPQVQKLMSFGVKVGGSLSPVSRLTLPDDVKRANNIPLDATHFVYCYQGCDLDALMALEPAQTAQLRKGSSEVSFLAIGGFVYINAASDEPEDIQEATVCGANAITIDGDDADKLLGSESASLSKPVVLERPCPLTALAAVPDGCATLAQLQAKLAPLNSRALLRYAEAAGLDESQIEAADEADNRKGAFEALILGHYDPRATESLLCVADAAGWVGVYTPSRWLKTTQPLKVPPLGQAEHGTGVASVVFSPKGDLIFVMLQSGDVLARDARSSTLSLIRKLEFHGCDGFGQGALSCADGLIAAVGGCAVNNARAGDVDSSRVAVWQLADLDKPPNQFTVANDANAVAVRPDGKELAIGTGNGTICIFSSGTTTEHGALDDPHGRSAVNTVNYSTDGKLLAAGRVSGVHTVYEVATAAVIAIFNCPNGLGAVQAFPPAGDVLAVGGHQSAKVTLRMLCPPTPIRCATIDGLSGHAGLHDIEKRKDLRRNAVVDAVLTQLQPAALEGSRRSRGQLSGAFVSRTALVAITIGQRLQVQNKFDDILWEITLGEPVGANMLMHNPVTMRPDSKQVACIVSAGARVIVRMMSDGSEAFTLGPWRGHKCFSVGWSPDGQYLVVMGSRGTSVHDQSGIELRVMRDGPGNVMGHAFGSKGDTMFLATCGSSNRVTIRSMSAPKVHFLPAQRMREGYSQQLVDAGRVQEITSPFLYEMGARQYCWLLPGEELTGTRGSDPWCPCPHGGFVYIFSKEHDYECYFSISDQVLNMRNSTFPDAIGPFTVLASTLRPELDFDKNTWKITQSEAQMQLLKDFGIAVAGALSPASPITLPHKVKRKNNIPLDATHFVFCYGGCDLSTLQQNQSSQLTAGSPELSFVSIGGFAYIKAASNLPADIRTGKVVGANAITVDPDADVDPRTTEWAIAQSLPRENGPVSCVCFDATCERIAYFTSAGHKCGTVVVRTFDGGDEKRFPGANAFGTLAFSPNGQFLVAAGADLDKCGGRALTVLDLAIDEEASWGTFFSAMSLPPGRILGNSIRWVEPPVANEGEVVRTAQLMLQVVVEDRLIVVDLMASKYAIEDHAWSTGQLIKLSEHDPAAVESVAAKAPHLINVRDDEGDTVLHELMRWRKALQIDKWFTSVEGVLTPIANSQGNTVLSIAIESQERKIAKKLWRRITPSLSYVSSPLVTTELRLCAETMPELVFQFLSDIEDSTLQTVTTFRSPLRRPEEVCGQESRMQTQGWRTLQTQLNRFNSSVPPMWKHILPKADSGSPSMLLSSKVVLIPNFLGPPRKSPFHAIVQNCPAQVFESKLLRLAVQYKWDNTVWPRLRVQVFAYAMALLLDTAATVTSARLTLSDSESELIDAAIGPMMAVMMVVEGCLLLQGLYLTFGKSGRTHLNMWKVIDYSASVSLLVSASFYFANRRTFGTPMRTVGALGVALKWFGFVDYLRCFERTGSLVRMVLVIFQDITPFLALFGLSIVASMFFFTVNDPFGEAFSLTGHQGLASPLVTIVMATLDIEGSFEMDTFHSWASVVWACVYRFLVMIVMLNLLIAIMGDSYAKIKEMEQVESLRERAKIIVDMELQKPKSHSFPMYMHIVEPADEESKLIHNWGGVTDRILKKGEALARQTDDKIDALEIQVNRMQLDLQRVLGALQTLVPSDKLPPRPSSAGSSSTGY